LATTLAGTAELTRSGDLAAEMVRGIAAFLDRALAEADRTEARPAASLEAHERTAAGQRRELARVIGVVDERVSAALELVGTTAAPALVASAEAYDVFAVRWPVLDGEAGAPGVDGEGLLLEPKGDAIANVVALPDAAWSPEGLAGLEGGPGAGTHVPAAAQFARRLAEARCRVVVPTLIDRGDEWSGNPRLKMTNQPHQEFVYRMAFQMGRHVIGYEVQKVLALVDYFTGGTSGVSGAAPLPVGVFGYGEGGLIALHAAALDQRIAATGVSGHFRNRREVWREPIYRNVWRLLRGFGDAGLAALVAPRSLVIEASAGPSVDGPPEARPGRQGAAPGSLSRAPADAVRAEYEQAGQAYAALGAADRLVLVEPPESEPGPGTGEALSAFLRLLSAREAERPRDPDHSAASSTGTTGHRVASPGAGAPTRRGASGAPAVHDPAARQRRQFDQLCRHIQGLVRVSGTKRERLWAEADTSSLEAWERSCARYRAQLWDEVIGRLPAPSLPPVARTRLAYERPAWTGHEVTLDLWPDVFAYGVLLLPRDLRAGERRPVVVCQHGLEGRPQDLIDKEGRPYHQFAARLADRGYVVYAPQNPYIGRDEFRWLQRKANPLGWSLFSFILAQHERTLDWLAAQPFVDPERIAFYGLSYGGKTAMRVPALLERYCLSICSGDFNEWIVKCASTDLPMSYMFTGEWEMFEYDLGHTFNYAEMAYLIAPRPFMVERGHRDGVALDEWVAFEYAKVRRRYADLKIPDRTEIAFFDGPHEIDATATFPFLDKHLSWTPPAT
jgi:dienelactone hydrolase